MPDPITAIVFDSNALGGGQLDVNTLEQWANACRANGAELWIPEVVAWEWAEHALRDLEKRVQARRADAKGYARFGLIAPDAPPVPELDHLIDNIKRAGAQLLKLEPGDARAALADQVRQEGPATLAKGIKTGAADSAWVRTLVGLDVDLSTVVVVTNDQDAEDFLIELANPVAPRVVSHLGEIRDLLEDGLSADEDQASGFDHLIGEWFSAEGLDALLDEHLGRGWHPGLPGGLSGDESWQLQVVEVDVDDDAHALETPTYSPWLDGLGARVEATLLVQAQAARVGGPGETEMVQITYHASYVRFVADIVGVSGNDPAITVDGWQFEFDPDSADIQII